MGQNIQNPTTLTLMFKTHECTDRYAIVKEYGAEGIRCYWIDSDWSVIEGQLMAWITQISSV